MLPIIARVRTLALSTALATAGLGVVATVPVSATGSPTTWHVQAGNLDDPTFTSIAHEVLTFYNARTVVHPGDDILFTPVGGHTVTFNPITVPGVPNFAYGNPLFPVGPTGNTLSFAHRPGGALLNSGAFASPPPPGGPPQPPAPATFRLHVGVDAAGPTSERGNDESQGTTYHFFCMFHREMAGEITVLPAGSKLPTTDPQNQSRAQKAMAADLALGRSALAAANRSADDGHVAAGLGVVSVQGQGFGSDSIIRFAPATITIDAGESVTWFNQDLNAPHTVTFGQELPGPPGAPPGFVPYGGTTITSPSTQVNSGFLVSQELVDYLNASTLFSGLPIRRGVTFTFPNAGTYHYLCALHDEVGMVGTIIVRADN